MQSIFIDSLQSFVAPVQLHPVVVWNLGFHHVSFLFSADHVDCRLKPQLSAAHPDLGWNVGSHRTSTSPKERGLCPAGGSSGPSSCLVQGPGESPRFSASDPRTSEEGVLNGIHRRTAKSLPGLLPQKEAYRLSLTLSSSAVSPSYTLQTKFGSSFQSVEMKPHKLKL